MAKPQLIDASSPAWQQWQVLLTTRGTPLPLDHRVEWCAHEGASALILCGGSADPMAGCVARIRSLPLGHRILRIDHFGATVPAGSEEAAARALASTVEGDASTLRLDVRVFAWETERRERLGAALAAAGFRKAEGGDYTRTLAIDLSRSLDEIFASFSSSARRNVRAITKSELILEPITDVRWVARLEQLLAGALGRTGGVNVARDWHGRIEFANRHPDLARLIGVFSTTADGERELQSFAWGLLHGDFAEYNDAAVTRDTRLRVAPGYPMVWDLVQWAHQHGARVFDLGGVTPGTGADGDDPLGGISDFKRFFSDWLVHVADEYTLDGKSLRARVARAIARLRNAVSAGPA